MPKRKKLPTVPDYIDGGRSFNELLVQKSNPLLTLSETDLTLSEFKILDAYLSRINSHEPDKRFIRFEKGVIEKLLGVTQIKPKDLEKRIDNLFQIVTIRDDRKPKGFTKIVLFEKAACYQDEDGLWQVDLEASNSAMEYIFNPENIGYLRYRLRNVINLTSRYSYILYLYLEHNRIRRSWDIPLNELKQILRCTTERYEQFKFFNSEILKKCHKELQEKTNLRYQYEPIRIGRSVKIIRFTIETLLLTGAEDIPEQLHLDESNLKNDHIEFFQGACSAGAEHEPEFSRTEMEQIFKILVIVPESKLPLPESVPTGNIDFRRYHYLAERYAAMLRADEKKPIKNRFAYFLSMIKRDAGIGF